MTPKPIADYLTDFDRPVPRAAAPNAAPTAPLAANAAPPRAAANDAPDLEAIRLEAFERGKREGLELAEARHALERRRADNEAARLAAERGAEAESRLGDYLGERLQGEIAALGETLSREAAAALPPFVREAAERHALDAMVADAKRLPDAASIRVSGPRAMVEALLRRLEPGVRERVRVGPEDRVDLRIDTDDLTLSTRLGELDRALKAA